MSERLEYTDIIVEKKYPTGYITINRPDHRNSLTFEPTGTQTQIAQACEEMRIDPEIRVFVIKGAGDCFCSGFEVGGQGGFHEPSTKDVLRKGREKEVWTRFSDRNALVWLLTVLSTLSFPIAALHASGSWVTTTVDSAARSV